MLITFNGRQYDVTTTTMSKPGLTGVVIDGVRRTNFRTRESDYRYEMKPNESTFPLSMSPEQVAVEVAQQWLDKQEEKKRSRRNRR